MNIKKIAKLAGVSTATVSRVINNKEEVTEKTREKVNQVIAEQGYAPSVTARNLSNKTSSYIGVVIPDIQNDFFSVIIREISNLAEKEGWTILLFDTNEDSTNEHRALNTVLEQKLRGLIITPVSEQDGVTTELLRKIKNAGTPVVLIDREVKDNGFDGVYIDNFKGAYDGTSALIQEGHQRIGAITGPITSKPSRERLEGYKQAFKDHQLPLNEADIMAGNFKMDDGYNFTKELLTKEHPPKAIFTFNNMMTVGALKYLKEQGYILGETISLIGFDDVEMLEWLGMNVSAVNRPTKEMGRSAFKMLLENYLNKEKTNDIRQVKLPVELILRGSEKNNA